MTLPVDGGPRPGGAAMRRPLTLPVLVATVAGIGFIPFAPGTFGSIPGLAIAIGLRASGAPWWAEGAALVLLFAAGVWAASAAETAASSRGRPEIVGRFLIFGAIRLAHAKCRTEDPKK